MLFFKTFLQIFPDCWVCSEGSKCPRRLFLLLPAVSCRHLYCLNCKEAGDDTGRCDCVSPSCVSLRAPPSDPVLWWSSVQSHGGRQRQAALRGLRLSAAAHRMVSSSCSEKHILLCRVAGSSLLQLQNVTHCIVGLLGEESVHVPNTFDSVMDRLRMLTYIHLFRYNFVTATHFLPVWAKRTQTVVQNVAAKLLNKSNQRYHAASGP